jgi:hypothetical protein
MLEQTQVDLDLGALLMKKLEAIINTLTPLITYLLCCNMHVTSLKSGTALKAVIMYISDYITKCLLKTHVVFDIIHATYQKNNELIGCSKSWKEKAQHLMTKIVNNSTKMEIGAPMACMYLPKNPDHYMNHRFNPVYWKSYVVEAHKVWVPDEGDGFEEKVTLTKCHGQIFGLSQTYVLEMFPFCSFSFPFSFSSPSDFSLPQSSTPCT